MLLPVHKSEKEWELLVFHAKPDISIHYSSYLSENSLKDIKFDIR